MKQFFKNVGVLLLAIVGIICIGIGVEKYRVYSEAAKIDWKVDDEAYLKNIFEEVYLQHENRSIIDGEVIVMKETELTNEPKSFSTFRKDLWLKNMSMKKRGDIWTRIMFDEVYYKEIDLETYGLPEILLQSDEIIIAKEDDVYPISLPSDQWYITHFNNESLILRSYEGVGNDYFVLFADEMAAIPLSAKNLEDKGRVAPFEKLLMANPMMQQDDSRFLLFDNETVWDRETVAFYKIEDHDLLSLDGQSVLLNYENNMNGVYYLQTIEQYIEKANEKKVIKIPEKAVIKKSTLPAAGLGRIDVLSFTSERIVFYSNTPSFIVGTAGVVKFSVDLTKEEPHFSIIFVEET